MNPSLIYCLYCTLPTASCVCQYAPKIELAKPWTLLYHPREYSKRSNTGRLLKQATNINSIGWHRLNNTQLQAQFEGYALLYPDDDTSTFNHTQVSLPQDHRHIKGYLILDATWQESHKMLRQSPWLAKLPRISVRERPSEYRLRRNQKGLSTLETLAYCLFDHNEGHSGAKLIQFFHCFQDAYLKAQQAGHLK